MAKTIKIRAELDAARIKSGADDASRHLDQLKTAAVGLGSALGVTAGAATLVQFLRAATKEAIQDELALKRAETQMRLLGGAAMGSSDKLQAFVAAQERLTGVADDQIYPAFQKLLLVTEDYDAAMSRLPLVLDLVKSSDMGVAEAAQLISKALAGMTDGFNRQLPALGKHIAALGETATRAEKAAAAMQWFNDRISGAAAMNLETFSGKLDVLARSWEGLSGKVGADVTERLSPLADILQRMLDLSNSKVGGGILQIGKDIATLLYPLRIAGEAIEQFNKLLNTAFPKGAPAAAAMGVAGLTDEERYAEYQATIAAIKKERTTKHLADYITAGEGGVQSWGEWEEGMQGTRVGSRLRGMGIRGGGGAPWEQPGYKGYGEQWQETGKLTGDSARYWQEMREETTRYRGYFSSALSGALQQAFRGASAQSVAKMFAQSIGSAIIEELSRALARSLFKKSAFGFAKLIPVVGPFIP